MKNIQLIAVGSRPWEKIVGYWGISLLIDGSVLFDTFSSYHVLARKLASSGVNTDQIEDIVISHDHWDHIGGLWGLLERKKGINIYLPVHVKQETKERIRAYGSYPADVREGPVSIKRHIFATGEMMGDFRGSVLPEQAIVVDGEQGLTLIVGCSHPHILNMVKQAERAFGKSMYGVIGGLHLMHESSNDVLATATQLKEEGISIVMPTHCTGYRAEKVFKKVFGDGFVPMCEGMVLSL